MDINLLTVFLLLILGFCTGVISSFFGAGGAFIITPSLNILGFPMSYAVATGLSYTLITSTLSGIKHWLANNIIVKLGVIIALFSFIGIRISHTVVLYLEELDLAGPYIRFIYIILLFSLGLMQLKSQKNKSQKEQSDQKSKNKFFSQILKIKNIPPVITLIDDKKSSLWVLMLMGIFIGLLQGILGAGGGFILVPLYMLVLKIPAHQAVGTSLLTIFISSSFGSFSYFLSGNINFLVLLILGFGTLFGINLGIEAVNNCEECQFDKLYAYFLLISAFGVVLKQFNFQVISLIYTVMVVFLFTIYLIITFYFQRSIKRELKRNFIFFIKNNDKLRDYYNKMNSH